MEQVFFDIQSNKQLTSDVYELKLAGDTSKISASGQFVNIKIDGEFLRRPISVCDYQEGLLTLVYKVVGKGTEKLSKTTSGKLDLLVGLGNGYDLSKSGDEPLLIGG